MIATYHWNLSPWFFKHDVWPDLWHLNHSIINVFRPSLV